MKYSFNKALSFFATGMVVAGMGVATVHAADLPTANPGGTITIENAKKDTSYTVYRIFDVSADEQTSTGVNPGVGIDENTVTDSRVAAYIATEAEMTFFSTSEDGKYTSTYFDFEKTPSGKYNVKAKADGKAIAEFLSGKTVDELDAVFPKTEKTATADGELKFENVPYGYYYVRTGTGGTAAINTATPSVTISDKTKPVEVDKTVSNPVTGTEEKVDEQNSTAKVGDVKNFEIKTKIEPGYRSFVVTDTMGVGLTLNGTAPAENQLETRITVAPNSVPANAYNISVTAGTDNQTVITVKFTADYLNAVKATTDITISYSATVNDKAVNPGLTKNTVVVNPGDHTPAEDIVKIFLGKADVFKYTNEKKDEQSEAVKKALSGAEFVLYDAEVNGNALKFLEENITETKDGKEVTTKTYRFVGVADATKNEVGTTLVSGEDGYIHLTGLPAATYWLQENKAPIGYNLMLGRQSFKVEVNNITSSGKENAATCNLATADVENTKGGAVLPSTGGMGTTMLYSIGGLMVAGAAVLIVVRKRVNAQ